MRHHLVQSHDTDSMAELQALALVADAWATEVVRVLPLSRRAGPPLKAFQRCEAGDSDDLLSGVLLCLGSLPPGAWARPS